MPPFGSVGSGLASYRDMTNVLRDKKGIKYSPICDLTYILTADNRNNYDKVTIVASNISSITCKQSNLVCPIPINLAVNAIAVGYALKALEPATRLFNDFGASNLSPSGYALAAMIFTFMIIQIVLAAILVRLNLENFVNNGRFKFLSFVMSLVASISLILLSTKTLMQEGERYYLE
ncbi:hypothetical protein DAPPUDRAFT_239509 [Daphnia pulex]|uniref:Uncharacterized protein n=1 Tax=Daphnia pulex TaxID=6669 RepID=E9G9I8_DAPPU|nr:hypothetical protein DAPPUDRAFT_239509 [Daphnia pulex]|eukprot:EFX83873.1 hypothetical protein DAPPUDRAFT_239509 [Daphnia pulex]